MEWRLFFWFIVSFFLMIFFSGIEMAFVSASRFNIELKRRQGTYTGKLLGRFIDSPAMFLGTTIIGFIVSLTIFVLQTNEVLKPVWRALGIQARTAQIGLELFFNVVVVLVFVEFIPRAFFRANSNVLLSSLAHVINFFYQLLYPVTAGLFKLSNWMLKYVFNVRLDKNKSPLTRSDLSFLFKDEASDLEKVEKSTELLENAQELSNIRIRQCLVPRNEILSVELSAPVVRLVELFDQSKRSRIIVYQDHIDNIKGYVHQLDLFSQPATIEEILLEIPAVPESMSAVSLINKLSQEGKSIAWVVDEFGGTAGIISMEDVLEELFGEIWDEYDTERFVEKRISEDEYIFSGRLELDYLEKKYDLQFEGADAETLSGYIVKHNETIPFQNDRIIIGDYEFDVMAVSDTRIEMVKLKILI
jgi:CBS domain containing-hemolysin-like protein